MRYVYLTIAILLAATISANAQSDLKKEVNVTRAYEPSVSDFFKQGLNPDMTDTTQLRPEFNYTINPQPLSYNFKVAKIEPISINTIENKILYPLYLKAGIGLPMQSILDFGYARELSQNSKVGVFITHYGEYAKIENDQKVKAPTFQTYNNLSIFGDRTLRNDISLAGEINYDFRNITRYGYYNHGKSIPLSFNTTRSGLGQFYHKLTGAAVFGNSFKDFSKVNFKISTDFSYFADRFMYDMFSWRASAEVGFSAGENGNARAKLNYSSRRGFNNLSSYKSDLVTPGILYNFKNSDFTFSIGADASMDITNSETKFFPQFTAEKTLFDGILIPFLMIDGKSTSNNYMNLSFVNPYIKQGLRMPMTNEYNGRLGVKGTLFNRLKYKLVGGYSSIENTVFFVNLYDLDFMNNVFGAKADDMTFWTGGLELNAALSNSFEIYGSVHGYSYDVDKYLTAVGLPDTEFGFGVKYKYRDKLFINIDATVLTERFFLEEYINELIYVKAETMVDMTLNADYFINKQFGVFFNLNNILNQKLYRFNRYPLLGINAQAGVKLSF